MNTATAADRSAGSGTGGSVQRYVAAPACTRLVSIADPETPEWQDALERNAWADAWETGDDLDRFLDEDREKTEMLLEELGL